MKNVFANVGEIPPESIQGATRQLRRRGRHLAAGRARVVVLRVSLGVHSHIGRNALSGRRARMIPSKPTAYGWITDSGGPIKVHHGFRLPSRPFLG